MTDRESFIAAIAAQPDEDLPRLAYADWLGDNATTDADRARAELIRVQVELAQLPEFGPQSAHVLYHKQQKERGLKCERLPHCRCVPESLELDLLRVHERTWRSGPNCQECNPRGNRTDRTLCHLCYGTGETGGLLRKFTYSRSDFTGLEEPVRVKWRRGWIDTVYVPEMMACVEVLGQHCVECGNLFDTIDCATCRRVKRPLKYQPTPWFRSVLDHTQTPDRLLITRVITLASEPGGATDAEDNFAWGGGGIWEQLPDVHPAVIPQPIFNIVREMGDRGLNQWSTTEKAVDALGLALVQWGRS